jgi:hypothetical protein
LKKIVSILIVLTGFLNSAKPQQTDSADFTWGNAYYFNLNVGESAMFLGEEVKLLQLKNHYNLLKIGNDTVWLKVSRRAIPAIFRDLRVFVADNRNVKNLTTDYHVHGLLKKDVLICLSNYHVPLLDKNKYVFPVSFNDGFLWSSTEDSHMFSYLGKAGWKEEDYYRSHEGIDLDMHDARGQQKHWLVALENSKVIWIEDKNLDDAKKEACVLLESESQPGIYYVYEHLYNKNLVVREGQKLHRGEPLGTIWGDKERGHLHLAVVKSDTIPSYSERYFNCINFFPQLFELYFSNSFNNYRTFSKGRIRFGQNRAFNGNQKNIESFEDYAGKGWKMGKWNTADKVEWISHGTEGNARLKKVLFENSNAQCINPLNYFEYEINVHNGVYRIRAKTGDLLKPSKQKIEFEGIFAANYIQNPGELKWTPEKIVRVNDGKLTVRIYIDEKNEHVSGLSEIVFQQAN